MSDRGTMGIGVVGLGHWGPNHVRGVMEVPDYDSFGEFPLRLRDADIVIPKLALQEPLRVQAEAFIHRLTSGEPTPSESDSGVRVVACLQAIQQSLQQEGYKPLLRSAASFPVAERLASEVFSLPLCPDLTDGEAQTVLDELHSVLHADSAQVAR